LAVVLGLPAPSARAETDAIDNGADGATARQQAPRMVEALLAIDIERQPVVLRLIGSVACHPPGAAMPPWHIRRDPNLTLPSAAGPG
jgi:hypothetical protein